MKSRRTVQVQELSKLHLGLYVNWKAFQVQLMGLPVRSISEIHAFRSNYLFAKVAVAVVMFNVLILVF